MQKAQSCFFLRLEENSNLKQFLFQYKAHIQALAVMFDQGIHLHCPALPSMPVPDPQCPLPCHRLLSAPFAAKLRWGGFWMRLFALQVVWVLLTAALLRSVCLGSAAGAQGELKAVPQQKTNRPKWEHQAFAKPSTGNPPGRHKVHYGMKSPHKCRHRAHYGMKRPQECRHRALYGMKSPHECRQSSLWHEEPL